MHPHTDPGPPDPAADASSLKCSSDLISCAHPAPTGRLPLVRSANDRVNDFARVDMRVGRIGEALPFPGSRNPSYRLRIDFGVEIGERVSAAQLTVTYPDPAALVGRLAVAVVNFPPRQIAGFAS